jgi:hypothetical protein
MKANITTKGREVLNLMRRTGKHQKVALNQLHTLKSLNNKIVVITTYLSILTINVNGLNPLTKRHCLAN